jgi:hypothetical protein
MPLRKAQQQRPWTELLTKTKTLRKLIWPIWLRYMSRSTPQNCRQLLEMVSSRKCSLVYITRSTVCNIWHLHQHHLCSTICLISNRFQPIQSQICHTRSRYNCGRGRGTPPTQCIVKHAACEEPAHLQHQRHILQPYSLTMSLSIPLHPSPSLSIPLHPSPS